MAGVLVAQNQAALTANGTTGGYVTVANNALFPQGAHVYLRSSTVASAEYIVTDLSGTTLVGLRLVQPFPNNFPQYGVKSDVSAYTTAGSATLSIPYQVVDQYGPYSLQ